MGKPTGPRMGIWGSPHHPKRTDGGLPRPTCVSPHVGAHTWGDGDTGAMPKAGASCPISLIVAKSEGNVCHRPQTRHVHCQS